MNIKNPQGRLARWITRLSAFDVEFVYRKGECNEVADCVSRNALAARLAKVKAIKHDGAHSGLNSAAREQTLARIRDLKEVKTGGTVTQHHAEFKQLASQAKGDVGLFEVTLHRTVASTTARRLWSMPTWLLATVLSVDRVIARMHWTTISGPWLFFSTLRTRYAPYI